MKKILSIVSAILFSSIAYTQVGINTATPQKQFHVNGSLQVTNELNIGGNAATAGNAGTAGQYLMSNGAGAAPSWETLSGGINVTPTSNGSVIAIDGKLLIAQEITVQMSANFTSPGTINGTTPRTIGNLNVEILDNENKYSGTGTSNSFTVGATGVYQIILNMQIVSSDSNSVIGIWDDTTGRWIARVNDALPSTDKLYTQTLITSVNMDSTHTYSFRMANNSGTSMTIFAQSSGTTGSGAVSQVMLKRLR